MSEEAVQLDNVWEMMKASDTLYYANKLRGKVWEQTTTQAASLIIKMHKKFLDEI